MFFIPLLEPAPSVFIPTDLTFFICEVETCFACLIRCFWALLVFGFGTLLAHKVYARGHINTTEVHIKTRTATPCGQVVSFGLFSICPLVGKLVCLAGNASIFCSAPVKLLPFLLILRILCSQNSCVCMKQGCIKLHGLKQSICSKFLVF